MKKIIKNTDPVVGLDEISDNQTVFVKRNGKFYGMCVFDSGKKAWCISNGAESFRHNVNSLKYLIKSYLNNPHTEFEFFLIE